MIIDKKLYFALSSILFVRMITKAQLLLSIDILWTNDEQENCIFIFCCLCVAALYIVVVGVVVVIVDSDFYAPNTPSITLTRANVSKLANKN